MVGPTISVVIPVYNGERFLREAIDSVLAQTYSNIELVTVNDGSMDGSASILASYGDRLHVVTQPNGGVGQARNAGITASRGEFIAFLDQDDWWLPEKLEKQVPAFLADSAVGLVHSPVRYFDQEQGRLTAPVNPRARPDLLVGKCFERLLMRNDIRNSSVVVRRAVLNRVGLCSLEINGNTVQDYDLWLRIARVSRLAYVPEELSYFRLHPGQGMKNNRQMLIEELRMLRRIVGDEALRRTQVMQTRVATLLEQLGIEHLDARDRRQARQAFLRSLIAKWSIKCAARLLLSFAPARTSFTGPKRMRQG